MADQWLAYGTPEYDAWWRSYQEANYDPVMMGTRSGVMYQNGDPISSWALPGTDNYRNAIEAYGGRNVAFNPETNAIVALDDKGTIIPESMREARTHDQAFWNAALAAGALVGGAAAGAYGGGTAGAAEAGAAGGGAAGGGAASGGAAGGAGATGAAGAAGGAGSAGAAGGAGMGAGDYASLFSTLLQAYQNDQARGDMASATGAGIDEQRRQFDLTRGDFAPWREAGARALGSLEGDIGRMPTAEEVQADPGYQFGLAQGMQALDRRIAAIGGRRSGAALKAGTRFATDYASTKYGDAYQRRQDRLNRLAALAGIGQTATGQTAQAGQGSANAITNLLTSQGDANAAARIGQGNIWGNYVNQIGAYYGRQQPNRQNNQQNIWGPGYDDTGADWGGWTGGH